MLLRDPQGQYAESAKNRYPDRSMREHVNTNIGVADSQLIAYQRDSRSLRVLLQTWNGSRMSLIFEEFIGCVDTGIGEVSELLLETVPTDFFNSMLQKTYVKVPMDHGYELYQFIDVDGDPSLEIVARAFSAVPSD